MTPRSGLSFSACLLASAMACAVAAPGWAHAQAREFNLPAQSAVTAIPEFARQADIQILVSEADARTRRTNAVQGVMPIREGLRRLIAGTGLAVASDDGRTVTLSAHGSEPADTVSATPNQVSEIVVTAQKRAENIQQVPVSISALSGNQLEQNNATQLTDYAAYVPGFQVDSGGAPGLTTLTLRGITTGAQDSATVGVYVDDVPFGSSSSYLNFGGLALDLMPYDIEQVEVLRGPQGTLYGASTLGGLLKYVTRTPNLSRFEGRLGATVSDVDHGGDAGWGLRGSVNVPVVEDVLAVRASLFHEAKPGYIDNAATGEKDVNGGVQDGGRVAVYWRASDKVSLKLSGMIQETDYDAAASVLFDNAAGVPVLPPFTTSRLLPENFKQRQQLYTATLNWDLGPATLTSATGYSRSSSTVTADASVNFLPIFGVLAGFSTPVKLEKVTQEIRLASPTGHPLQWLVGGFFTQENGLLGQVGTAYDPATLSELPPPINPLLDATLPSHYREFAVFGDATYRVTDALDLDLGLRWARNDQDFHQILSGLLVGPPSDLPGSSSDDVVTYSASTRYHFSPDVMVYGRVATGYRPGGPNLAIPGVPATFGPDTLTNYELGLKSEFLDRRLLFDVTLFHIDWKDIQTSASTPLGISYLTNAGTAKSDGVELTAAVTPVTGLKLGGSLALIDARLSGDTPEANAIGGFDGDRLPLTPRTSASLTANYEFPLSGDFNGRLGGVYRFVGARESRFPHAPNDVTQTNPETIHLDSYQALDLNAGVFNDRWTLSLFARNVLGEQAFITGGLGTATVLQPRTVGVSLDTRF